jgi:PKD repeat protein
MAPSLSNTNTWSSSSITQINSYVNGIGCLSQCQTTQAPEADFSADNTDGCTPFVVHFIDESTGPPATWQWTFPGGSPNSSTQQHPQVTYNTPGSYDVILVVTNSVGSNTLVRTDYITVQASPVASFDFNQIDLTLFFTSLSQNADNWDWDFGDGGSSTQENPSHTYNQDGEYEIVLTVSNDCGTDEHIVFIEVYVAPVADFSYTTDFGCAPLVVNFINESSDNVQDLEWFFPGGSPSSSTQENPVVTYSQPGFYSVTLIVENVAGLDELTINNLIEVVPLPEADFNFAVNGLSVQFINASIDGDDFLWVFGDGMTSTAFSPNHTYESGGTYQTMLVTSNECGSDTAFATIMLNSAPIADFTVSVSTGCVPLMVTYTSTSQGEVTTYNWSFPGGSPASSSAPMPTVTYNAVGVYSAQLIVGNSIGSDTIQYQDIVEVFEDVNSGFTYGITDNVVDFTNTSTGAQTYLWLVDGETFTSADLVYAFDDDGDYLVMLIATGPCGSDTTAQTIHIATLPEAGIASGATSGCQPLTVQFYNNSSSNATTFAWVFEGGTPATSSEEDPLVAYNAPGVYDVQLTVWSETGMDVLVLNDMIEVSPLPVSVFGTDQSGLSIDFINTSLYADTYFWTFGDGGTSDEEHPEHTYGDYGTYTVTLISTNDCGSDTTVFNLELSTAPVPAFSAGQTQGCVPVEIQFTDMSQNSPEVWEWSFPGGNPDTSNLQNPVVVYFIPGVYSVTLRVSNGGGAQALVRDQYIYVATPPLADFGVGIAGGEVTFTNESEGGNFYLWSFGDGGVDTAANPVHVYGANGTYDVQLITWNVCAADTIVQEVTVMVTAVNDPENRFNVQIYPNPHRGAFNIRLDTEERFDLEVYDILGHRVLRQDLISNINGIHEVALRDPQPGVYTVALRKEDYRYVVKMIVVD